MSLKMKKNNTYSTVPTKEMHTTISVKNTNDGRTHIVIEHDGLEIREAVMVIEPDDCADTIAEKLRELANNLVDG